MIASTVPSFWIGKTRVLRISNLALPLIAGAVATNVMSFVDTLMVGQLGNTALAGVGLGGQLFFLLLAGALGIAAGVQAMVARRVGEGQEQLTGQVLNVGILLATTVTLMLILLGYVLLPPILGVLSSDPLLIDNSLAYLNLRLPGLLFIGINIAFRSYWVGVSLAKWSMVSVLTLSVANIVFNYLLIFGHLGFPKMGVAGAGLGSTLALLLGLIVNLGFAWRLARKNGFLQRFPDLRVVRTILQISYPESVRQLLFSLGVVVLYVLMGQIGTRELAAFHVIISICMIAYMPHIGMGGAATTLVGEALGRKDVAGASLWGWQVSNASLLVLVVPGILVALFPLTLLRLFLVDEMTLVLAVLPLQLAVFAHVLDGYAKVLGSALIGAGATQVAMRLTLLPLWLLTLPLIAVVVSLGFGLIAAMGVFLGCTLIAALLFVAAWQRRRWTQIEI